MIDGAYVQTMARYNAWQNRSLYTAADTLTEAQRREDRGAFFGSIHTTLAHILWADTIWMSRLAGGPKPEVGPGEVETWMDWPAMTAARVAADGRLADWAAGLGDADLAGDLVWFSGIMNADTARPRWICVAHLFNHQTHHRGQVHALLTSFGARPDATDLCFMPDDA